MKPRARVSNILVQKLPGETLLYDLEQQQGYCLGEVSAAVRRHCDGQNKVDAIAKKVTVEIGRAIDEKCVRVALAELSRASLLMQAVPAVRAPTRRSVLSQMAAAVAVTVLVSPRYARASLSE